MQAIVWTKYGAPDVLQLGEVEKPIPKDNEVLIRVYATTVTAGDCEMRAFKIPIPPLFWLPLRLYMGLTKPRIKILGQELAGKIEAVGKDVTQFSPGDQVFAPTTMSMGAYAEYICLPSNAAIGIKPANIPYEEAAAMPVGGLNAIYFLQQAHIQRGEKVLINGAGGSIGTAGVQLAKYLGAEVTGVDSASKLKMLRKLGADHVIDYEKEDFAKSGATYDVIFDIVGDSSFARCESALAPKGRYLLANPTLTEMARGLWVSMTSDKKLITGVANYREEEVALLTTLIANGQLTAAIDRRYPLAQVAEAHRYVETGAKKGNVVITIG